MGKTKILDESADNHPYDLHDQLVTKRAALEAMEVFVKATAIGFAKWADDNYFRLGSSDIWTIYDEGSPKFTTEQLYNLYKTQK